MTEMSNEFLPEHLRVQAAALSGDIPRHIDYFAATATEWVVLPDGVQKLEVKVLTEGERKQYLAKTNQEFKMNARTKDLTMKSNAGDDRHALLKIAVVDWTVYMDGTLLPFTKFSLERALDAWPPVVVDAAYDGVAKLNPWLTSGEDDVAALEAEQDDIAQRLREARERAAKN